MCFIEDQGTEPDVFHYKTVKARKVYKCEECGCAINPGNEYERCTGLWEGRWETHKVCLPCVEVRNQFCCSWTFGHVWEAIGEADDLNLGCLGELSPEAIAKISDHFEYDLEDPEYEVDREMGAGYFAAHFPGFYGEAADAESR